MLIISATNLIITEPIAALLGVPTILSTEPEIVDNRYTGRYLGTPTYQQGNPLGLFTNSNTTVASLPAAQQAAQQVVAQLTGDPAITKRPSRRPACT